MNMFSRRGQLIVLSGVFFLTSGFAFINYYLVLLGIFLIFASIIGLPFFKMSTFIENLEVERKIDRIKVFARDFFHVKVLVRNKGNRKIDWCRYSCVSNASRSGQRCWRWQERVLHCLFHWHLSNRNSSPPHETD